MEVTVDCAQELVHGLERALLQSVVEAVHRHALRRPPGLVLLVQEVHGRRRGPVSGLPSLSWPFAPSAHVSELPRNHSRIWWWKRRPPRWGTTLGCMGVYWELSNGSTR